MSETVTKKRIVKGFGWKLLERFANQGLTLAITLALSRILGPAQYTKLAIINIFITIADVFVQSGLSTALIQKKEEPDQKDYSSVFFMSFGVASVFYALIFFLSPMILGYFNSADLVMPLRVTSLVLFLGAFTSVQNAIVARKLDFKIVFISCISAGIISGTAAIIAAVCGLGIWALVIHFTVNRLIMFIVMWIFVKWRPQFTFSGKNVKKLFSFGWKVMLSSLIDAIYQDARSLFIKKKYPEDEAALGIYNRGQQVPQVLVTSLNGAVQTVMLPALSAYQSDRPKMKSMVRRAIMSGSYIIYPMMAGLLVMAGPLIQIVLGDKWLASIPILQIYCLNYLFWPTHSANLQAVNALGRSDKYLIMEIIKKFFDFGILIASLLLFENIAMIAWGSVLSNVISSVINAWPNKKLIDYGYFEQIKDVLPNAALAVLMGGCVFAMSFIPLNIYILTAIRLVAGVGIYVGLSKLFKLESFNYILETMKEMLPKKEKKEK